jgi:hypothetical protein
MPQSTNNYGFQKPFYTDSADIHVLNQNFDAIDAALTPVFSQNSAPSSPATTGKLAAVLGWIANRIKAITGKTNWFDAPATTLELCNTHINNTVHTPATASKAGSMSAADKSKLDGVALGAQKNSDITKTEIEARLTGSIATHTHANATSSAAGLVVLADNTATTDQSSVVPYHYISSPGTVDLNTYSTVGDWTLYSITTATNFPPGTWTGSGNTPYLEVRRWYTNAAMRQILHKRGTNEIWIRYCTSATAWGVWERISTDVHTHDGLDLFGSCSTAAATAAKVVTITGYLRNIGNKATVKFTITNTSTNPTLDINGTGTAYILYMGNYVTPNTLKANGIYDFVWTGTYYEMLGATYDEATTSAAGLMSAADKTKLNNAVVTNAAATMAAILTAQSNTSYTTKQVRNIVFWTSGSSPPSTANGDVIIKTFI